MERVFQDDVLIFIHLLQNINLVRTNSIIDEKICFIIKRQLIAYRVFCSIRFMVGIGRLVFKWCLMLGIICQLINNKQSQMSQIALLPCLQQNTVNLPKVNRVKTLIMKKSSRTCAICIDGFKEQELIMKLPCGHIYHRCCLKGWMKKSTECPLCRHHFSK